MNPTNTGSFGAALGGMSPELAAAVQSRQGPASGAAPSSQVSASAPTADPTTMAAQPPTGAPTMPSMGGAPTPSTDSGPLPFDSSDLKMILGSFNNILKGATKRGASPGQPAPQPTL